MGAALLQRLIGRHDRGMLRLEHGQRPAGSLELPDSPAGLLLARLAPRQVTLALTLAHLRRCVRRLQRLTTCPENRRVRHKHHTTHLQSFPRRDTVVTAHLALFRERAQPRPQLAVLIPQHVSILCLRGPRESQLLACQYTGLRPNSGTPIPLFIMDGSLGCAKWASRHEVSKYASIRCASHTD
eukprot:289471-Pyramimonas_sp.AAC.1